MQTHQLQKIENEIWEELRAECSEQTLRKIEKLIAINLDLEQESNR